MVREVGVFCGTFNPIHWGHLVMAEMARDQFSMDSVLMITSPSPPHRHSDLLPAELRYELVQAATQDNPRLVPSRIELDRQGPSYTYDTIKSIYDELAPGGVHLNLIIGEDNLAYISQWHRATELLSLCRLVVAPRDKQNNHTDLLIPKDLPEGTEAAWLNFPRMSVSSSMIRERLRSGKSVLYLVPPAVNKVIEEKGLYR